MRLFGGEMMISGIAVENIFSPIASIGSSVEFREIDLGLMTDAFEFGHVTGVLQGYVRGLVITADSLRVLTPTSRRFQRDGLARGSA